MHGNMGMRHGHTGRFMSAFAYWTIILMHDNPLLPYIKNPYQILKAAGLKQGQKVLEVGCGPGFYTLPAADMVGDDGVVYAVDVNPRFVKRVQEKAERKGKRNVVPMRCNASDTGLPGKSIDTAFMFGLPHIVGGSENVLSEMHRILKPGGVLSFQKRRVSEKTWIKEMEMRGFMYSGRKGSIFLFRRQNK